MNKYKLITLIIGSGLLTSVLSSCGFFNLENATGSFDSSGDTPHLSLRGSGNTSDLYDRECEGNSRCEETCEEIYEKSKSYSDCYDLSIGEVADLDDLFHILVKADEEELDDIDSDIFEEYLKNGVDGFTDKVIENILDDDDPEDKIENIFNWMIENEAVAEVLNEEDDDNDVLKELLLARCNGCTASDTDTNINGPVDQNINIRACVERNDDLFLALFKDHDNSEKNFFLKAEEVNNIELFSLGHEILVEIFSDNNNDREATECIRGFYCLLKEDDTLADFFLNEDVQRYIGTIDTYRNKDGDTLSCRSQDFSELSKWKN